MTVIASLDSRQTETIVALGLLHDVLDGPVTRLLIDYVVQFVQDPLYLLLLVLLDLGPALELALQVVSGVDVLDESRVA